MTDQMHTWRRPVLAAIALGGLLLIVIVGATSGKLLIALVMLALPVAVAVEMADAIVFRNPRYAQPPYRIGLIRFVYPLIAITMIVATFFALRGT